MRSVQPRLGEVVAGENTGAFSLAPPSVVTRYGRCLLRERPAVYSTPSIDQLRLRPLRSLISYLPSTHPMASRMLSSLVPTPTLDLSNPAKARSSRQNTRTASVSNDLPPPPLTRTAVSLEYASLRHTGHCPLGMYVTPSPDNLMVWDAVFFVHQGTRAQCPSVFPVRCGS